MSTYQKQQTNVAPFNVKKAILSVVAVIVAIVAIFSFNRIGEDVKNNQIVVNQYPFTGKMAFWTDPAKMRVFGAAEHKMFKKIAMAMPRMAEEWLEQLEPMHWNNYLTRVEADEIVARLEGADGTMGPHWGFDTFKKAIEGFSGHLCEEPFYNFCALWATANMLYSDHSVTWGKHISREDEPFFYYQTAVDKLKDKDRPHFVREYFHLTD